MLRMSLATGTRLGPYEILAPVGAGGMGEVYRARDTRLDRTVAIKVLPSHLSDNASLKQRFEREARTISSLSHPNICALHDIGHQDGIDFLVMEFLEGQTLADRISKGPLSTEHVMRYGIEIADALDKAHRQGIIHRDLKPGNIMITKSGAKLLDFGLAKFSLQAGLSSASTIETADEKPLTEEGLVLGTVQYMAPEQLEGRQADARTDIFALGSILFEMATGKRAFTGKSKATLISSILATEPQPISQIQPLAPSALDHVVKKCLLKDPDERWQSAHDVASELKWIAEQSSQSRVTAPVAVKRKFPERILWAALVVALAALSAVLFMLLRTKQDRDLMRFHVVPEKGTRTNGHIAISPDETMIAFGVENKVGEISIYVKRFDSPNPKRLPGTDGATNPYVSWSPDSRFLLFFAHGKLKKIDVNEGPPMVLADAPAGRGATWSGNTILFASNFTGAPISRVSPNGGAVTEVTTLNEAHQETSHRYPLFLPDGKHFLYAARTNSPEHDGVYVGSLDSKETQFVTNVTGFNMAYSSGHLLYPRQKNLIAQPFDAKTFKLSGEPHTLADHVGFDGAAFFFAANETMVAFSDFDLLSAQLAWRDRDGKETIAVEQPRSYIEPLVSLDEKKVLVGIQDAEAGGSDLWLLDLARKAQSRITYEAGSEYSAIWSPDNSTVVYAARRKANYDLYQRSIVSGGGEEQLLLSTANAKFPDDWSRDGRYIIYENEDAETNYDLYALPLFGDRKPFPYLRTKFNEAHARFSPDGKWVAYVSDEIGRSEVYVKRFPQAGAGKWQISTGGGDQPAWGTGGKELFYMGPDGNILAVEMMAGENLDPGVPKVLFNPGLGGHGPLVGAERNFFDVSQSGRILMKHVPAETHFTPIATIRNWTQLLKKQTP